MMDLLEIFLQVWDIREQFENGKKLVYEMEEIDDNGKKKKQKSFYKTSQRINSSCKLKDKMLDFPKEQLKNYPDIMFKLEEKFKDVIREEMGKLSSALLAIFDFVGVMVEFFGLDLRLEPARIELKEEQDKLAKLIARVGALSKEYNELVAKVTALEIALQVEIDKLKALENQLETMQRRKVVAIKLTDGLKGEKQNWLKAAE